MSEQYKFDKNSMNKGEYFSLGLYGVIIFLVVLYLCMWNDSSSLHPFIINLFRNPIFKLLLLALIVYRGYSNSCVSLLIVIAFLLVLNSINEKDVKYELRKMEAFNNLSSTIRY